jgi:hypothetical protein
MHASDQMESRGENGHTSRRQAHQTSGNLAHMRYGFGSHAPLVEAAPFCSDRSLVLRARAARLLASSRENNPALVAICRVVRVGGWDTT